MQGLRQNPIDALNCLVVDTTYRCNATCRYCRWGDPENGKSNTLTFNDTIVSRETLANLGTERVVFSGGEPLLRKDLEEIIQYYSQAGLTSIITITNGLLLDEKRLFKLIDAGITGITFSLDGADNSTLKRTRNYSGPMVNKILKNIDRTLKISRDRELEIGINCVVSKGNLSSTALNTLVEFANDRFHWIKFSPIFDDGYTSINAPELLLNHNDAPIARFVGPQILQACKIDTNPIGFWNSLAEMLEGKKLDGESCNLDNRQAIAIRNEIKFCAWLDNPTLGKTSDNLCREAINKVTLEYKEARGKCATGPWCFCLQKLNHSWSMK